MRMHALELYDPDNRWRHRHPAEKALLAGGMLVLAVALPPGPITGLVAPAVAATALLGARVSWRHFLAGLTAPLGFLLVGILPILISPSWQDGGWWPALSLNVQAAEPVLLRGVAATTCLVFFATTTSFADFLFLLRGVRCPLFAIELMMLTHRFGLSLVQTAHAIRLGQRLRHGGDSGAAAVRSLGLLAACLLPRSIEQGRRLAVGLETRGFDGALRILSPVQPLSWPALTAIAGLELALAGLGMLTTWRLA
jgi:cobalt/nickel transport system permease protein